MRAISWNVNSLRTRLERVLGVLERHQPDLLCLQETKVTNEQFPHQALAEVGYKAVVHGQKTYNGVALLSKVGLEDVQLGFPNDPVAEEARVISAKLGGLRFVNLYVINGKEVGCDKYVRKMAWLDALNQWLGELRAQGDEMVVLGDFNIAPEDRDVYDPDGWRGKIHFSEEEHERLTTMQALGLEDLYRLHHDQAGLYSWWDYRGGAFPRDHGLRIDLALGSPAAVSRCTGSEIDRDERKKGTWEAKPSDHAPVIVDFSE